MKVPTFRSLTQAEISELEADPAPVSRLSLPSDIPSSIRSMSDVELGWISGLLEGDGSFLSIIDRGIWPRLAIRLTMTDEDVIRRCVSVTGDGRVWGPYSKGPNPNWKLQWHWGVGSRQSCIDLMMRIYPLMGVRRQSQIRHCLQTVGKEPNAVSSFDSSNSDLCAGWIAGILEAEGSFSTTIKDGYLLLSVALSSSDSDIVKRCHSLIGGTTSGPHAHSDPKNKDMFNWGVRIRSETESLMRGLHPLMGDRRRTRILEALDLAAKYPSRKRTGAETVCLKGHVYSEVGAYTASGHRQCRKCYNDSRREWRRRQSILEVGS